VGLKGRLSSLPLADVLKLIDSKGHTGQLSIESEGRRSVLYLERGFLIYLSCLMDPLRVGLRLARTGSLPRREYLGWKLAVSRGQKSTTVDFYPGENIPQSAWQEVFDLALQDESLEIFSWQDGEFEFESGTLSLADGLRLNLPIATFLNQAAEQSAGWEQIRSQLPQEDVVPAVVDFTDPDSLVTDAAPSESEWKVLAHVDGRRDLRALSSVSSLSYFATCQGIVALVRKGYVQWAPRPQGGRPQGRTSAPPGEESRGLLQRLTSKERNGKASRPHSPIALLARFENQLLERLENETGREFNPEQFLETQWRSMWVRHPLVDGFPLPGERFQSFHLEDEVSRWEDPPACEEVVLDCLCALQELVEATYRKMEHALGEKKALQGYRKDYEQVLGGGLPDEVVQELSWLSLAR